MTYNQAKKIFSTAKNPQKGKPIANNTYIVKTANGYGVKLHQTVIVNFTGCGHIQLNTNGWYTVTTKRRMNDYLPAPYKIVQKRGHWFVSNGTVSTEYEDDMYIRKGSSL